MTDDVGWTSERKSTPYSKTFLHPPLKVIIPPCCRRQRCDSEAPREVFPLLPRRPPGCFISGRTHRLGVTASRSVARDPAQRADLSSGLPSITSLGSGGRLNSRSAQPRTCTSTFGHWHRPYQDCDFSGLSLAVWLERIPGLPSRKTQSCRMKKLWRFICGRWLHSIGSEKRRHR